MSCDRRVRRPARPFSAAILGLWLGLTALAPLRPAAAEGAQTEAAESGPIEAIEALRHRVDTSDLDELQREAARAQLEAAAEDGRATTAARARIAALKAEAANSAAAPNRAGAEEASEATGEVADQLALQEWAARLLPDVDVETLEELLESQRRLAAELSEEIEQLEADLAQILARPAESGIEIAALRHRIEELARPLATTDGESELLFDVRQMRRQQELLRVEADLALRTADQDTSLARQRQRENGLRIEWLQSRIAELSREELDQRTAALARTEAALAGRPSVATTVARENRLLGEELLEQTDALAADRRGLSILEPARDRVVTALNDSRTRLELGGASEAVGRWLWSERRSLEPTARLRRRLEKMHTELAELRLRRVTLSDARRELADVPAAAKTLLESSQAQADDEGTVTRAGAALEALLRERLELQMRLEPILQRRIRTLEQSEATLREEIETTQILRQLLDRYLLWTPSHGAIDSSWLERVPEGVSDLVKPSRWKTTFELAREEVRARPVRWIASLLLLVGLVVLRRRAPAQIREHEAITRQIGADHIGVTLDAFLWTLVAALPIPAALAMLGSLLQSAGTPGRYSDSVGRACLVLVIPLFAIQTLRFTALDQGLGHAHLRWMRARRVALWRTIPRAAAIVVPMYFISALAFIRNLDLPNDVQARVAIVIACAVLAWAFWQLLDVGQIWVVRGVETEPSKLRKLLRFLLPLNFVFVAGLALAGYVYSAGLLLQAWIASLCVVIAVAIGIGVVGRWFLVGERRLALRRLEERRADAGPTSDEGNREPGADDITLEQVNAQTHSVLRMLRIGLLTVGLVVVWAGVLPAITRLDEVVLWTFSEVGADGVGTRQPVSLMAALFGALAFALTFVGSRNLPGLIELGLLSQTSIDAASRYAITSLLRYALVIAGTLVGLDLLGMRWSQLQWMAAALTVGLGFGLQEIFANFVSGLILLFERPFRVGDVITVDDLTGRVTRIRTRATTILDFDNREIVVPNKTFITGQLLNWTLTDTTTRVTIKVGVAYGTDADRVHRLLMQAAIAHPLVLREPEPHSWFMAFGASTLDFELRVFVGTLNDRLQVMSELHREIARLFSENGVEIAFPQMDLNVRDLLGTRTPEAAAAMATAVAGAAVAGEAASEAASSTTPESTESADPPSPYGSAGPASRIRP
jgi:potassium efflux system protein